MNPVLTCVYSNVKDVDTFGDIGLSFSFLTNKWLCIGFEPCTLLFLRLFCCEGQLVQRASQLLLLMKSSPVL